MARNRTGETGTPRLRFWKVARSAVRFVWRSARRELSISLVAELVSAVALAVLLVLGGRLVAALTADPAPTAVTDVLPEILGLGGALFVTGLASVLVRDFRTLVAEQVLLSTQEDIVDIATSVDYENYERQDFNDLLERANTQGSSSAYQLVFNLLTLFSTLVTSLALVAVLASVAPVVLLALVVLAVPFVLAARASAKVSFATMYQLTTGDRLRLSLYHSLTGSGQAQELRVFGLAPPLRRRWREQFDIRIRRMRRLTGQRVLYNGLATFIGALLTSTVLVLIVRSAVRDEISLADAAVAIVALQQLSARIRSASASSGALRESALFLDDFDRFRALRRPERAVVSADPLPPFTTLRLRDVSFTYPGTDRPVLRNVSFDVQRGEIVALVGLSGSGKTTLAHLVAGLYTPTSGTITWDGIDVSTVDRPSYWRSVGVVFQEFARYELTARENVAVSDHSRLDDLAGVRAAARQAGIDDALAGLADGYETILSRAFAGGAELSVGQWQRIAVARAFFREAPLLILDEPAAALDAVNEQALFERLQELCATRTVLLVSHRFSTVRLADRICVVRDGELVEQGTHDELVAADGHYANLYRVQAEGYLR